MHSKNSETPMAATIEASNLSNTYEVFDMSSIATAVSTINVPFHGSDLYVVSVGDEAYTPMRPIIDGMGLTYQGQADKLKSRFSKGVREIMIPTKGGQQTMLCLALRKLNGWLQTISPNKVKPEIRDKVIQYQEECDDVLYEYWTKGEVKNPRKKTTVDERTPLRDAVNMLVGKKGLRYDDAYNMVHQRFAIDSIDELELSQIPQAVEYIHRVVLDGEFIGKQLELPAVEKQFTDEEVCSLAWLWLLADKMREHASKTYPALEQLESRYAGEARDLANEFKYWLDKTMITLSREASHIKPSENLKCIDSLNHLKQNQWRTALMAAH